ncbi:glyoxylase-like metal-dependent hydrolase (beta-lactamase superfamily II) [Paenibacillus taihuensis]|uniref:Glyoxylase-like metal-dependent hydrolase (Beta-lactamase superfamily II) n=1 Tax=Paenibacillus taihuensis TaxID=1156355 RepID=A0A3D9RRC7_9BACL|nr:N-acyl homoserine lactonase family protein [Paenibacillus taihuensis]REE78641.1 glyoxylase-like metal-dependent hydrolase (beta-lactamase superfamily II) [Paenibacillus taihuensis]
MTNARIHVWHTGEVYIDQSLAFREKTLHPLPYTGWLRPRAKKRWVPVSVYLIEHPSGLILVDTGWHTEMRENQRKHLGAFASSMFKGRLPAGEAVHEQLSRYGVKAADIDYVLLTHLHSDHVSGLKHVSEAKQILVSEPEWNAAQRGIGYIKSMWQGVNVTPFEWTQIPYGPYKLGLDLFQDGSVYLVHTPGHSAGQFSVLVRTKQGWVLLASDVGYGAASFAHGILPGSTTDKKAARRSLDWVKEFMAREDCLMAIANHDVEIKPQIIGCPAPWKSIVE